MSGPSDCRLNLNLGEEAVPPSPYNIWRPSFISPTGYLTVGDSVMKNDMTAAVVARNLVTPKDNRLLSKLSDELAEIRKLKRENRELHILANSYSSSMKRKLDQLQESEGRIQSDHQMFVASLQRHLLPSSSRVLLSVKVPNSQPPVLLLPGASLSGEVSNSQPSVPFLPEAPPSDEALPPDHP
ncbi:unnamed protein product [Malus baccata var. baccata]